MRGELPVEWWTTQNNMRSLRHLYINNNQFSGNLTDDFVTIGNNRLSQFVAHDNNFTGMFPGKWDPITMLQVVEIQRAGFTSMDRSLCRLSVLTSGELTALKSDCAICNCGGPFCRTPSCSFEPAQVAEPQGNETVGLEISWVGG